MFSMRFVPRTFPASLAFQTTPGPLGSVSGRTWTVPDFLEHFMFDSLADAAIALGLIGQRRTRDVSGLDWCSRRWQRVWGLR